MKPNTDNDLVALKAMMDQIEYFPSQTGDYAELVDENDPNGLVHICRQDGQEVLVMSREVYEEMKQQKND